MQYKLVPQLRGQRSARVCDLLDRESGQWDPQLLINLFRYQACMIIVDMVPVPSEEGQEDVLICNLSSNGRYKVKDAYKYLRNGRKVILLLVFVCLSGNLLEERYQLEGFWQVEGYIQTLPVLFVFNKRRR